MNDAALRALDPALVEWMIDVRRRIHAEPELSNQEVSTQALVREELVGAGIEGVRDIAGTGLVVDIGPPGGGGRTLAVRADLDALPIQEETALEFRSRRPGVMHACGHDAHTAMVLAAAVETHRRRDTLSGTARFVFQPAEEAEPLGGRTVVESGLLDDVDAVIGLHVDPNIECGHVGVRAGPFASSADEFDVVVHGLAGHGGRPHEGVDAITIAAGLVQELQKVPARQKDPQTPLVITIGRIEGGQVRNIVAERVTLEGTIRAMDEAVRALAHQRLEALATGLAVAHGGSAEVHIRKGESVIVNESSMVELIRASGEDVGGPGTVLDVPPWTAADDFAFYSQVRPSVYFRLGVGNADKGCVHGLHHPGFMVDEDAMPLGAAVIARAVQRYLGG